MERDKNMREVVFIANGARKTGTVVADVIKRTFEVAIYPKDSNGPTKVDHFTYQGGYNPQRAFENAVVKCALEANKPGQ